MNKTININLGGVFFHIDEIAYQKLKKYLDAIRRSLSDDPKGKDEIITDIESRIGELLSEKVKDVRQVINESDINEVVDIMGKPEDYMVDDDMFEDNNNASYQRSNHKKLYRDADDKFLGGVSSGIAHYFNIDTIWVRLGWLVATFGGGFGIIAYIILWILLPEATTTSEKLEMEGEDVNISNIEKKIKDEISDASSRVKNGIENVSDHVKNADYSKYKSKAKSGSQDIVETLGKIFTAIFKVIGKLIGVFLIFISASTIIGLTVALFMAGSLDFIHEGWFYENAMGVNNAGLPIWMFSVLGFVLIGIPFFFLFSLGLRILSNNTKSIGKVTKLSLLGIWLVALLLSIFFGTKQAMESAYDDSVTNNQELQIMNRDTLYVKLVDNKNISSHSTLKRRWNYTVISDENQKSRGYSNNVRFDIHASDDNQVSVKTRKKSDGKSRMEARENAQEIVHGFILTENELRLDGYFLTEEKNTYKDQKVYVDLYLPENQVIYLDRSTRSFLDDVDNTQNIYDRDMAEHYFKMTKKGLECLDCDILETIENGDIDSFNMKIDDKGVHIKVKDDNEKSATLEINERGVTITESEN